MERNVYLEVEYLGTGYFGFQIQNKRKGQRTVQGEIEAALRKLFRRKIRISYAGRTDRGVHAKAQVVNFTTSSRIPLTKVKSGLNAFLPADIRVNKTKEVPLDFHARFAAKAKIYRYLIFCAKDPSVFWKDSAWHIAEPLDRDKMLQISRKITGKKDFSLFAREAGKYSTCVREIRKITLKKAGSFLQIDIEADGFLRHMARNIVSFLVRVGRGEIPHKAAVSILKKKAPYVNKPAPAVGLYLYKVKY